MKKIFLILAISTFVLFSQSVKADPTGSKKKPPLSTTIIETVISIFVGDSEEGKK